MGTEVYFFRLVCEKGIGETGVGEAGIGETVPSHLYFAVKCRLVSSSYFASTFDTAKK